MVHEEAGECTRSCVPPNRCEARAAATQCSWKPQVAVGLTGDSGKMRRCDQATAHEVVVRLLDGLVDTGGAVAQLSSGLGIVNAELRAQEMHRGRS